MDIEGIFRLIDTEDAISFLQSLIRMDSVNLPGNDQQLAMLIKERLEKNGLSAEIMHLNLIEAIYMSR